MTDIFVIDAETTGLSPTPRDIVLQIAITKVDIDKKKVKPIYNKVIGYDIKDWPERWKEAWIFANSDLSLDDIDKAYEVGVVAEKVGLEVHNMLVDKTLIMYNLAFDYGKFLRFDPFNISRRNCKILPCLMVYSASICKLPFENNWGGYSNQYKWPTLTESFEMIVSKEIKKNLNIKYHDASQDTIATGYLLLELIENHDYKL